jgi:1-acyl-sn-glycerol-3-phosphate acyltransferase
MASNHQSFLDPVAVGIGVSRQVHYMARRTLFEAPGFGRLIRALKAFPVERGSGDLRAIRGAVSILSGGGALLLFPEGTRSPDGSVREFKPGFALVAARARVPVVPVAVDGTFEAWPRARWLPRAGPVRVAYGEPLDAPAEDKAACIEAAMEVQRRVVALREELRGLP